MLKRYFLAFGAAVLSLAGQGLWRQPALVIDLNDTGRLHAWLNLTVAVPGSTARAFVQAVGCPLSALKTESVSPQVVTVDCAAPLVKNGLRWSAQWDFSTLSTELSNLGAGSVELNINHPRTGYSILSSPPLSRSDGFGVSYHGPVPLRDLHDIRLEAGIEQRQIWRLLAMACVVLLLPLLLLAVRHQGPLAVLAAASALFCAGATAWLWIALPLGNGAQVWLPWKMLGVSAPMVLAVWMGARIAGRARRKALFWRGFRAAAFLTLFAGFFIALSSMLIWMGCCAAALVLSYWRMRRTGGYRLQPLGEGELLTRVRDLGARAGAAVKSVHLLVGGEDLPAAFATRYRGILLSRGLLQTLSRREVDAVVCHELSHVRYPGRVVGRGAVVLLFASMVLSIMVPASLEWIPLLLPVAFLLHRARRRRAETLADADAVAWSGDPEALITGLVRVTLSHKIPLEWPRWVKPLMPHPSTMERVRAVAHRVGVPEARFAWLLSTCHTVAADVYPISDSSAAGGVFSPEERRRLNVRLSLVALAIPILFGVAAPFVGYMAALLVGAIAACLVPEWMLWRARMRARAALSERTGVFSGFSPSAEPRTYDGSFDYDWGFAAFEGDCLVFRGDRSNWTVSSSEVDRIRICAGPFAWLPRPVVCFRLKSGLTFSLRPFDHSFGPAAGKAASRLLAQAAHWHATATPCTDPRSTVDFSLVQGQAPPQYTWRTLFRALPRYCSITLAIHWVILTMASVTDWTDLGRLFGPVGVTCALAIFMAYPNLRLGRPGKMSHAAPLASAQPDR